MLKFTAPEKMKKIGFAFAQNKVWELGMTENKLVFKRRTQGNADQTMLFRYAIISLFENYI